MTPTTPIRTQTDLIDWAVHRTGTDGAVVVKQALIAIEQAVREDERKRQRDRLLDWLQGDGPALSFDPSDGASVDPVADLAPGELVEMYGR